MSPRFRRQRRCAACAGGRDAEPNRRRRRSNCQPALRSALQSWFGVAVGFQVAFRSRFPVLWRRRAAAPHFTFELMRTSLLLATAAVFASDLAMAQANSRGTGYNGALTNISAARSFGRRGAAYPGGEVGVAFQNDLCNPGTMNIEWRAPMQPDHPKFSFLVTKLVGDRMIQISDWSYNKHAFLSLNDDGPCGTCQQPPAGGAQMGPRCSDVYANSNNGDRRYLAPPSELDPWLGTWNPVGSYFDVGDPQTGTGAADGIRSLVTNGFDSVKNRVTIKEADLVGVTSNLFFQIHVIHEGEPLVNRGNNTMSRPFGMNWSGASWSASTSGTATHGTVLTRWTGATLADAANGNDDGRFQVAVKVTGPTNGLYHYEYAVYNHDNNRGGAAFRLPVCPNARVSNLGFRDIDQNPLNQWTATVSGGEIAWSAPANNPHNWNQLFNFWFDSDAAPVGGAASIDQARVGPGNLTISVATQTPGFVPNVWLGAGCGNPTASLLANGAPTSPNPAFALILNGAPNTGAFAFYSFGAASIGVGPGCTQYLDAATVGTHGFLVTNGLGVATIPLAIPAGFSPIDITWQAATIETGGPVGGQFGLSNGLTVRLAGSGCQ
ncbi:MAG: hypothetical protein IPK26_29165 [Planctomycetes bacterium]|nr:hypothetical protein [Planctomycetota bacterium]